MLRIMNNEKHYWLYALKLEQGKYYVGITSKTPEERFKEHLSAFLAAEWTKIYKPIKIDQTVDLGVTTFEKAEEYENKVTRRYIKEYGFNNVRGGDITYRGSYVKRFGYLYTDHAWELIFNLYVIQVLITVLGLYIVIDYIFDKKVFGLWP
jgi:predicted GIY-YIG superfamily endonuclease